MKSKYAIQLCSLHEEAENNLPIVLRRMKECDVDGVELFQLPKMPKDEFASLLETLSIEIPSVHLQYDDLLQNWQFYCDYFMPLGLKHIVMPGYNPDTPDDLDKFIEGFSRLGENIRSAGSLLLYHNHTPEFEKRVKGGEPYWFTMERECENVGFQLDTYWAKVAGYEPLALMRNHGEKIKSLHYKNGDGKGTNTDLDEGIVYFAPIVRLADEKKIEWSILEYETSAEGTYGFCKNSVKYLRSLRAK